jgi:putative hemolysin
LDDWSTFVGPLLILFALLGVAGFSACSAAFLAISKNRLRRELASGHPRIQHLLAWRESPGPMLSILLVGDYLFLFLYAVLFFWWISHFQSFPGWFWGLIVLGAILLVLAEFVARTVGVSRPLETLVRLFPLLSAARILRPLAGALQWIAQRVFRLRASNDPQDEEEVRVLADFREEVDSMETTQREMISSIFDFKEKEVSEVMVPRLDVVAIEDTRPLEEALRRMVETGHSRMPVWHETMDSIVGVLLEKDAIPYCLEGKGNIPLSSVLRRPFFVPESKKISELLAEMQRKKTQIALVVDEYGGLEGLVTMEDLLEEIVGEIHDEHDQEAEPVQLLGTGRYMVSAGLTLRELGELALRELVSEEYDTIGGLLYSLFQHIPKVGEEITFEGIAFRVSEMAGNRLLKIEVNLPQGEAND